MAENKDKKVLNGGLCLLYFTNYIICRSRRVLYIPFAIIHPPRLIHKLPLLTASHRVACTLS